LFTIVVAENFPFTLRDEMPNGKAPAVYVGGVHAKENDINIPPTSPLPRYMLA